MNRLLDEDVRNNSAWNQRYFLLKDSLTDTLFDQEVQFIIDKIHLAPNNESPWNYLKGLVRLAKRNFSSIPSIVKLLNSTWESESKPSHAYLLELEMLQQDGEKQQVSKEVSFYMYFIKSR